MNHSLKLSLLFLRIALGLNFIYLGWSALFNQSLEGTLSGHAMGSLYVWLNSPNSVAWLPALASWVFLVAGVCLVLGLFTRLAALLGVVLVLASYVPTISFSHFALAELINDDLIVFFCLLVLIFGKAGHYFGVDKFLHWKKSRRES